MKNRLVLAFPVLAILAVGLAACEEPSPSSGGPQAPDSGVFDGGGDDPPVVNNCPEPTAPPVVHDKQIEADETWGPGLHDVTFGISVRNATLTLEPCAVVRVVPNRAIHIGFSGHVPGKLVAKGQPDRPIILEAQDAAAKFGGLQVNPLGNADLAYFTIKNGGDPAASRGGGALHLLGDGTKPLQELATVDHVTIEGSPKYGAILETHAAFTAASRDLVIKGSGELPMRVSAQSVGTIPTGKYTGNATDGIRLYNDQINTDATMHDRGVPYMPGGDGQFPEISVVGTAAAPALLTIEAGVTIKFSKHASSGLHIQRFSGTDPSVGALRVLGTADKPVVFTSNEATPAPGDWIGIVLQGVPDPRTKIEFARVEYAGGDTGTRGFSCGTPPSPDPASQEAAIQVYGQPTSSFITNTTITKSAANGIERGWRGTPVDFLATNTFTEIAYCRQTFPRDTNNACPDPAPCD